MLADSTRKYLCRVEGLYDQEQYRSFAAVLCLIPENVYGHTERNNEFVVFQNVCFCRQNDYVLVSLTTYFFLCACLQKIP